MAAESATVRAIYRYPVKGLSPEALDRVAVRPGETLPADRLYAIENGPSGFDPAAPAHLHKIQFLMLMRNERLASLRGVRLGRRAGTATRDKEAVCASL